MSSALLLLGTPPLAAAPGSGGGGDGGVINISPLGLGLAAALLLVQAAVSLRLRLGLQSQVLIAGLRCIVQLSLLGYILVPIFNYGHWWLVLLYASFMVWISAVEAIGRPSKVYKGMFLNTLAIITLVSSAIMGYALTLIIGVEPWWSPQYLIPILGMVLGNTISGISIGLAAIMEQLSTGRERIERMLALGASRSEATADALNHAVKLAMTPLLNQMNVVGLVSIPGMMTGQILSGSSPASAARYQMVIMFLLGGASAAASVASVYAAVRHVVDGCHRLRPERLLPRRRVSGVNGAINELARGLWLLLRAAARGLAACLCCCCRRRRAARDADSAAAGSEAKQPLLAAEEGEAGPSHTGSSSDAAAAAATDGMAGAAASAAESSTQASEAKS